MSKLGRSLRKAALVLIAAASAACGVFLMAVLMPDGIREAGTGHLLGLLGLLVLPAVTLAALDLDRRAARRATQHLTGPIDVEAIVRRGTHGASARRDAWAAHRRRARGQVHAD